MPNSLMTLLFTSASWGVKLTVAFCVSAICAGYFVLIDIVKKLKHKKELEKLHAEYRNKILTAQLEIQEQTFENMSRDIHDNIGQKLSLAKFQIALKRMNGIADLSTTEDILTEAIADLRHLSRSISAEVVIKEGLLYAIRHEIALLEKTCHFKIDLNVSGEVVFLPGDSEIIIYRIYQEALQNILKHAAARAISVNITYSTNWLKVDISDNGKGFPESFNQGAGMNNMAMRAKMLQGTFTSESSAKGALLCLSVPLKKMLYPFPNST